MRIAFITAEFPVLSETFVVDHITGMIDRGHDVDIFADTSHNDSIANPNVEKYQLLDRTHYWPQTPQNKISRVIGTCTRTAGNFLKNPRLALKSSSLLLNGDYCKPFSRLFLLNAALSLNSLRDYDVIHCQFGPDGIKGMALNKIGVLGGKLVVSFRGHDLSGFLRTHGEGIYQHLFKHASLILPVSDKMRQRLIKLGCEPERVEVLGTGIDIKKFTTKEHNKDSTDTIQLISVGRLVEKKGFEYSIRAVAKLAAETRSIDYEIIGDGPLRKNLETLINELDAADCIRLIGAKPPEVVAQTLKKSDIMLIPSVTAANGDEEGIPNTTREGMATGLPIIATDHGGFTEIIKNGESGFIVPEHSVDKLIEKLGILIQNPKLRSEMGRNGREFVEKNDDIEIINDRLEKLFQKSIGMNS